MLAKAVSAPRGVPQAKLPAEPAETAEDLAAQLMDIDDEPVCPECNGQRLIRVEG